jgi:hypothetical protein
LIINIKGGSTLKICKKLKNMVKRLIGKLKTLRLYFVRGSYGKPERRGLNVLKDRKLGYGVTWCDYL